MMPRILFVDDQPQILDGIRRMLRTKRDQWEMVFANSGAEALTLMEQTPFDVVVTDMKMPQMTGAQLLFAIKHKFPTTMRVVLSGYYEEENIYRCVGWAHQYLMKPCDSGTIIATVERMLRLRDLLNAPMLLEKVQAFEYLPVLSGPCSALIADLNASGTSEESIAGLVEKYLPELNKMGLEVPEESEGSAVRFNRLRAMLLAESLFQYYEKRLKNITPIVQWSRKNALDCERLMRQETEDPMSIADAYAAGLLSCIGIFVLWENYPEQYAAMIESGLSDGKNIAARELEIFGVSHADIGALLLHRWGFGNAVIVALAYHHKPGESDGLADDPVTLLHVAESLSATDHSFSDHPSAELDTQFLSAIGAIERSADWKGILANCA